MTGVVADNRSSAGGGLHDAQTANRSVALQHARRVFAVLVLIIAACGGSGDTDSRLGLPTGVESTSAADSVSGTGGGEAQAAGGADRGSPGIGDTPGIGSAVEEIPPSTDQNHGTVVGEHAAYGADSVSGSSYADISGGYIAPLTGLPTSDPAAARRRALAVKVGNNQSLSRPQAGLAEADVVFEVLIEAARTRFLAVYHSGIPARIGPIRSARSSDVDLMPDLGKPYFVSSGGNGTVLGQISSAARKGILINGSANKTRAYFERSKNRRAPYNLYFKYTDPAESEKSVLSVHDDGDGDLPVQAIFAYAPRDDMADAMDSSAGFEWLRSGDSDGVFALNSASEDRAGGIRVRYRGSNGASAVHIWDADIRGWVRIQDGTLHVTETDSGIVEIAPANVLVLMAGYKRSTADSASPQVLSYGTGEAWLLTGGAVIPAVWERTEDRVGFHLTDSSGQPLTLTPGKTWVLLANQGRPYSMAEVEPVSVAEGAQLLTKARAASAFESQ